MAHEAVEVSTVSFLAECDLHGSPMVDIEFGLMLWRQAHQDEITDQVSLTEFAAGGVHALEDQLRVVLGAIKGNIYNHELVEPVAQWYQIVAQRFHLLLEVGEVLFDAEGMINWPRFLLHRGNQAVPISLSKEKLVVLVIFLKRVEQIVAP